MPGAVISRGALQVKQRMTFAAENFQNVDFFERAAPKFIGIYLGRAYFAAADPCGGNLRHKVRGNWSECSPFLNSQAQWPHDRSRREALRVLRKCRWGSRRPR